MRNVSKQQQDNTLQYYKAANPSEGPFTEQWLPRVLCRYAAISGRLKSADYCMFVVIAIDRMMDAQTTTNGLSH